MFGCVQQLLTAASIGRLKPKKAKVKNAAKPKDKDAVKPKDKDALKQKDADDDAGDDSGDDSDKDEGDDSDTDSEDKDLIRAAATKEELEDKHKNKHKNSVESDAEEFFENVVKSWDLKLKRKVTKAVLYNVGGAQHFLNDTMERTHDRWNKMVRIAPRSLLRELCLDLGEITKERPLHSLMGKHSDTYLAYLVKHGLSSAKDLRRLYSGEKPSFGSATGLAEKEAQQKEQDESPPLVFTTHAKRAKVCVPAREGTSGPAPKPKAPPAVRAEP